MLILTSITDQCQSYQQNQIYFRFQKEVVASAGVPAYRFSPPEDVFASSEEKAENMCFCPHGPPCAPSGFFNVSLCQLGMYFYLVNMHYLILFVI